jgi:hypothetical protein
VQLRDLTGEGAKAIARLRTGDRYAVMDPIQLAQGLNRRAMQASERAADENLNDVSNKVAEFRDTLRDFDTTAGRRDRDERRDCVGNLLKNAQAEQREPLGLPGATPNLSYLWYLLCVTRRFDLLTASPVRDPRPPSTVPFC